MMNYFGNINKTEYINQKLSQYLSQLLFLDLQQQYNTNIKSVVQQKSKKMVQDKQNEDNQIQEEQIQKQETCSKVNMQVFQKKYALLLQNTTLGIQIIMKTILTITQKDQQWQQSQQNDSEGQQIQQENQLIKTEDAKNSTLKKDFIQFIANKSSFLQKYINLTFPHTQNIVYLAYHLIMTLPIMDKQKLSQVIQISINCQFSRQIIDQNSQILIDILELSLKILLKCQGNNLNNNLLLNLGYNILRVSGQFKQCWIVLLELYSRAFNPEKRKVEMQQNFRVGTIQKKLLVQIPNTNLQQWRGQIIDTLFDVYSNEQFDKIFVQLGFMQLLQIILQKNNDGKKKNKITRDVLKDIKRFIEYKRSKV